MEFRLENTKKQPIGALLGELLRARITPLGEIHGATIVDLEIHANLPDRPIIDPVFRIPPLFHFSACPRNSRGDYNYLSRIKHPRAYLTGDVYMTSDGGCSATAEYTERIEKVPTETLEHFLDRFAESLVILL